MDELPDWTNNLKPMYCRLRLSKHNKALRRRYYREIEKEKLSLAEEGINQEKIRLACRFLSSVACIRDYYSSSANSILQTINTEDVQISLKFTRL